MPTATAQHFFLAQRPSGPPLVLSLAANQEGGVRAVEADEEIALSDTCGGVGHACGSSDLVGALRARTVASGWQDWLTGVDLSDLRSRELDSFCGKVLGLPRGERWREAVSTALLGGWCDPLLATGELPATAVGALKAEARQVHRQLVPLWRRGQRHGRVLSLDAALGDGLSLHNLVATEVDFLAHTAGGVFEDERLNRVLRALTPAERQVVLAYAAGDGTTWTEAAAHTGAPNPAAFGESVRCKTKRLRDEQARRIALGPAARS